MPKRAYPRKSDAERRIVISFSISGLMLNQFRARLAEWAHVSVEHVSVEQVRGQVRQLTLQAIEDYNATAATPDPEWNEQ